MLFALCSCDLGKTDDQKDEDPKKDEKPIEDAIKNYDQAKAALEAAGYHTAEGDDELKGEIIELEEGETPPQFKVLVANHKEGVPDEELTAYAEEAIMKTKNFVWAFYFENEADANKHLAAIQELTEGFNEMMEETFQPEYADQIAQMGFVNKTAVCKQEKNIIYFGTEAAIEIAK